MDGVCGPPTAQERQETFWGWVDQQVRAYPGWMLEQVLLSEQQEQIGAGWNERLPGRSGWRNGFYRRGLLTPHGPLRVKVPRCCGGGLEVLGFCVSTGEQCRRLLADLRRRGLENVELFVSDDSAAIRSALEAVYPDVSR